MPNNNDDFPVSTTLKVFSLYTWSDENYNYDAILLSKKAQDEEYKLVRFIAQRYGVSLQLPKDIYSAGPVNYTRLHQLTPIRLFTYQIAQYDTLLNNQIYLEKYDKITQTRQNVELLIQPNSESNSAFNLMDWSKTSTIPPAVCLAAGMLYSKEFRQSVTSLPIYLMTNFLLIFLTFSYYPELREKHVKFMDKFQKLSPFKAAVVAPIKEELLFRGMLLPLIELLASYMLKSPDWSSRLAILISAVTFGYVHIDNDNPVQVLGATFMGIVLAMKFKSNGFAANCGLHMASNLFPIILMKGLKKLQQSIATQKPITVRHTLRSANIPELKMHFNGEWKQLIMSI